MEQKGKKDCSGIQGPRNLNEEVSKVLFGLAADAVFSCHTLRLDRLAPPFGICRHAIHPITVFLVTSMIEQCKRHLHDLKSCSLDRVHTQLLLCKRNQRVAKPVVRLLFQRFCCLPNKRCIVCTELPLC